MTATLLRDDHGMSYGTLYRVTRSGLTLTATVTDSDQFVTVYNDHDQPVGTITRPSRHLGRDTWQCHSLDGSRVPCVGPLTGLHALARKLTP